MTICVDVMRKEGVTIQDRRVYARSLKEGYEMTITCCNTYKHLQALAKFTGEVKDDKLKNETLLTPPPCKRVSLCRPSSVSIEHT